DSPTKTMSFACFGRAQLLWIFLVRRQRCARNKVWTAFRIRFRLRRCSADPPPVLPGDGAAFSPLGHLSSRFLRQPGRNGRRSTLMCCGELVTERMPPTKRGDASCGVSERCRLFEVTGTESK